METINTYSQFDKNRLLGVRFHSSKNAEQMQSHGVSHLEQRLWEQDELGDVMGFDDRERFIQYASRHGNLYEFMKLETEAYYIRRLV